MRYPRHVTLELTAKCNFRCPYCYCVWHEYPALAKPELDAVGWKTILDKCAADGVDDILFTGGEALLRSDLFEILNYARRILPKARLSLFTNASRLEETLIKKFKRRKIHLATSLQGLRTYGAMTGTRRSYKRLLAVVARASELKWPIAVSRIRALPDAHVPYTFCDEFICSCRADTPKPLIEKWEEKDRKPCPAGKSFGVVGPNGLYRTCLHSLPTRPDTTLMPANPVNFG